MVVFTITYILFYVVVFTITFVFTLAELKTFDFLATATDKVTVKVKAKKTTKDVDSRRFQGTAGKGEKGAIGLSFGEATAASRTSDRTVPLGPDEDVWVFIKRSNAWFGGNVVEERPNEKVLIRFEDYSRNSQHPRSNIIRKTDPYVEKPPEEGTTPSDVLKAEVAGAAKLIVRRTIIPPDTMSPEKKREYARTSVNRTSDLYLLRK